MSAYFDESGTHGASSPAVIMGGFIASSNQWAVYEAEMTALLASSGVKVFHARKLRTGKGDFKEWTKTKRGQFNSSFLKLADDHMSFGMGTVLASDMYQGIYRSGGNARRTLDSQYGLCFRVSMWRAMVYMRDRQNEWPLNVILETGHKNARDAIRVYGEIAESLIDRYRPMLGAISFMSKDNCLPLAMADSLSYAMFRKVAGFSNHSNPDVASTGYSVPPDIAAKVPMTRLTVDETTLTVLRNEVEGGILTHISLPD